MKSFIYVFLVMLCLSCEKDKPYYEFEEKLVDAVCKCISLKNSSQDTFLIEYEACSRNTSALLRTGLDHYPEDARLSKEAYLKTLPKIIKRLPHSNRCAKRKLK